MRGAERGFEALEPQLAEALAWQPSARSIARIDARVSAVLRTGRERHWRRPMVLLAAAVALMGAAISLTLVQQAASLIPGHKVAYDRGTVLNLSRSVEGYTVVLERAWLDPNQLVLAFSVPDTGSVGPVVPRADVVDSQGRHYLDFAGGDVTDVTAGSGSVMAFDVPPGVTGRVHLTVTVPFLMTLRSVPPNVVPESPLRYEFDLSIQSARTITIDQTADVDGRSVDLRWIRFTATAVRLRLDTDLAGLPTDAYRSWMLDATLRRPDRSNEPLSWMALPPEWTGQPKSAIQNVVDAMNGSVTIFQATSGTDDPTGTWTITVNHLVGLNSRGGTTEIPGPWVFEVTVKSK